MNTQGDLEQIEHLDFESVPTCDMRNCGASNPPAIYRYTLAAPCGCGCVRLACQPCHDKITELYNSTDQILCGGCNVKIPTAWIICRFEPLP